MLTNNIKIAVRGLIRQKTFTLINIAGLGLGMAAAMLIFLWMQNEFSYDRYHRQSEHIYRINTDMAMDDGEVWHWSNTPMPLLDLLETEFPEVVRAANCFTNPWVTPTLKKNATTLAAKHPTYVSADWFKLFDHQFISGSPLGFEDNLKSAILTRDLAQRLFGRFDVAGETFQLDTVDCLVQAVVENHPVNSGFSYELIRPMRAFTTLHPDSRPWNNFNFNTFAEFRPGAHIPAFEKKLAALVKKHKDDDKLKLFAAPLAGLHFDETRSFSILQTGNRRTAYTFGIIGFIILLLACVNYVSLTTAQASRRAKGLGVRKIIGAGSGQILRMLLVESWVMSTSALIVALLAVQLALPVFNNFTEKNFQLDAANPAIWLVAGGTLLATLLLSGIYPAFFLLGISPNHFLRGRNFLNLKNAVFQKGLVVLQFSLTVGLVIGAMVITRQEEFIRKKDLGYQRAHIFEFQVPYSPQRESTVEAIRQELSRIPGIVGTAATNSTIINMESTHSGSLDWPGKPDAFVPTVAQMSVDGSFQQLVQLPLAAGRWFKPGNQADLNHVLLNETAVQQFQLPEPVVGSIFHFQGREGLVIGVVKDFNYQSLRQKIEPLVLYNSPPSNGNIMVKTAPGQAADAIAAAEAAWDRHFAVQPFDYSFLDDTFDRLYKNEAKNTALFKVLAALAILISCLGFFGLATHAAQQRVKEIGIRKVLGASVLGIVGLLSKDFFKLVALALLLAAPLSYYFMQNWLADFAYHINISWWILASAGLLAVGVAALAISFQSVKAALANPVKSLRSE